MAERPAQEEIDRWHGWFAREANNTAWSLTERDGLGEQEKLEALLTAYASVYHWSKIGTETHLARGRLLLSRVHSLRGEGGISLGYARQAFTHIAASNPEPWELAFAHAAMADAAAAANDPSLCAEHYRQAEAIGAALDEEDRLIFNKTFDRIPAPTQEHAT